MSDKDPRITAFIQKIDLELQQELRKGPMDLEGFQKFAARVVDRQLVSQLPAVDHSVLALELVEYIRVTCSASTLGAVSIGGQLYAIQPVDVTPARPSNLDTMRNQQRDQQSRELFRPFLVRQIYSYLVGKALLGHTTTYENIANEFGLPNKGNQLGSTLSPLLSSIYEFCETNHQPLLTVIVVRKSGELKDLPGNGFWSLYNAMLVAPVETIADRREYTRSLQKQVFEYWGDLGK